VVLPIGHSTDLHSAAIAAELDRVRHQAVQDQPQQLLVRSHGGEVLWDAYLDRHLAPLRQETHVIDDLTDSRRQANIGDMQLWRARIDVL